MCSCMNIQDRRINFYLISALSLITLTLAGVWWWASQYNYIPCISDCGETFISQLYARNYRLFGLAYGLVEDHATSPLAAAHPYYYTHNVNIGGLFYTVLEMVGIHSFWAKQFCVLLVFGIGLLYIYLSVAYHCRSDFIAFFVLLTACSDFGFFLSFSMHALRVWSWLAIFGLLLHVGRFAHEIRNPKWIDIAGIIVFGSIAFGVGYEFWILCSGIALAILFFCCPTPLRSAVAIKGLSVLCGVLIIPFILRQIHIAAVLGIHYWMTDFFYTFVIKVPFAGLVFHIPSIQEIDQYYQSLNIVRPPSVPTQSLGHIKQTVGQVYNAFSTVIVPTAGLLSVLLVFAVITVATLFVYWNRVTRRGRIGTAGMRAPKTDLISGGGAHGYSQVTKLLQGPLNVDFNRLTSLITGLSIGMGAGCLIMLRMVVPVYIVMAMPLLGAVFVLCKGSALGVLGMLALNRWQSSGRAWWPACFAILMVADHAVVQVENARAAKPMDTSWISAVARRPQATYAVSFIAPVVAGFTANWAVGIKTGEEGTLVRRINAGEPPFAKKDLFWFGERDADKRNWIYLRPDYWLYFLTDRRIQFYAIEPECRKDYLSRFLSPFTGRLRFTDNVIASSGINPNRLRPGDQSIVEMIFRRGTEIESVNIMLSGKTHAKASYNCITNGAVAEINLSPYTVPGSYPVSVSVKLADRGRVLNIPLGVLEVDSSAPPVLPQNLPRPQPTTASILSEYPNLKIAEKRQTENPWEGFLLIDLRGNYPK